MRCVVLSADNRVVNVVELAERAEWSAPAGCALLASDVGDIGDSFDGTAFVPPVSGRTPALRRLVRRSVIVDRLQAAGNLPAARAALDAADLYTRERWSAREAIYADDPTAIALLQAIGADPEAILAP
jgi:hypothetical protein